MIIGGDFFIFTVTQDKHGGQSIWRKDHHKYVLRKGSLNAVREDQMKLKFNGVEFAICSYTKGSGVETPESFKRRGYWLKDSPKYILVHYLDEANQFYLKWL